MKLTLFRPGSTEYALFVCFDPYFHAVLPLDDENCLKGLDLPISLIYGDRDWMKNVGTHDLLSQNPLKGVHSHTYELEDSDHNLFFDNPDGLIALIRKDLATLNQQNNIDQIQRSDIKPLIIEEEKDEEGR
jgi:pimeloyl-ACP methyl ester carboxylesterase